MKNIDNIILNSLRLINYDRSKHITEQISLPTIGPLGPAFDKFKPSWMGPQNNKKIFDINKVFPKTPPKVIDYEQLGTYSDRDFNFTTDPAIWKNTNKSNSLPKESTQNQLISIISVAPNETLYQTQEDYNKSKITPLEWAKFNEPYNESKAINYFGSQCMKLSGRYPKFNVGYSDDWDYYVSSSSNTRCKSKKIKVVTDTDKNKIEFLYQKKLLKPITLKNGSSYNLTKFTYDPDCTPIDYSTCLRYAWQSVFTTGVNNNSVLKFKKDNRTLVGCMTDNWFPWYNRFVGYIEEGKSKVKDPYTGIFNTNKCNKPGNEDSNFSGVVKVENILKDSGLGDGSSGPNPPNALSPFSMGLSLQEFNLRGNLSVDWNLIYKSKVDFYDSLENDLYTQNKATGKYGLDNEWNDKTESYINSVYMPKIKNFIDKEKFEDGLIWVKSEYEVIKNDENSNKEILLPWFKGAWDELVEAFDNAYTTFSSDSYGALTFNGDLSKKKEHPATKPLYKIGELPKTTKVLNFDTATVDELKKLKEIDYQGREKYDHTTFWGKDPNQPIQKLPNDGELSVDEQIKSLEMMNQNIINSIKQGFILPSNGGTNFKRFG